MSHSSNTSKSKKGVEVMESQEGGATIWPIPEEDEGTCGLAETNDNLSQSGEIEWGMSPMAVDAWTEIHIDEQSTKYPKDGEKRGSTVRGRLGRGGRMFIARRPYRRQYSDEKNVLEQGRGKSDRVKNEHGKTSGGVGSKTQESDGIAGCSKIWSKPSVIIPIVAAPKKGNKSQDIVQNGHNHSKSWSAPGGYSAYFNTVSQQMKENNGLTSVRTPYNQQESYKNGKNNNRKQFNKAPGSLPYARENLDFKNVSFQNGRYWYGGHRVETRHYTTNDTRRYGRGAYHNTARSSAQHPVEQRGNQKRLFIRSTRNFTRGAGIWSRGPGNCSRGTGEFSRRGNGFPRGERRPFPRRGAQTRRQTFYPRPFYINRTSTLGDNVTAHAKYHVPPAFSQPPPSTSRPTIITNGESFTNMNDGIGNSTFTIPHGHFAYGIHNPDSSFVITDTAPELLLHRTTLTDSSPCDYVSVQVHAHQSPPHMEHPYDFQGTQWTLDIPFHGPPYSRPQCLCPQLRAAEAMGYVWRADDRPVMPVMVPQNPPVGTPVYYQQPVMGAAWSPYVPLVETYNEMPCYPADYGNSGYYTSSYANPVYQNNPMEFMPANPAGDPAGHVQNNLVGEGAVPPQSEVQQTGEAQNRPPVCSQCGGCGSCGHCTCGPRPRTSPPVLNHEADPQPPSASRTVAEERPGPINFGAQKSVKDDGSDLPKDIATLRFFYNLGVDAHRSASRCVSNGNNTRPAKAQEDVSSAEQAVGDEISSLVGRLHRVVFRQSPEPQELEEMIEEVGRFRWIDEDE